MTNPFINNKNIGYYFLAWALLICAHFLLLYYIFSLPIIDSLLDSIVFNILFCGLGLGLWYTVRYYTVENKRPLALLLSHISASLIISTIWILFSYIILRIFSSSSQYLHFLNNSIFWRYVVGLFYYAFTVLVYYVILFYSQFQEKKIREASLIIESQESELKRLRSQINPHFIFNTLNSISSLTLIAPERAQEMVIKLSEFLRYSLKHDSHKKVPLKEEIDNVKLYLEIEKIRFGERFNFIEDIKPECLQKMVPDMILQPLIENAIKHSVYESLDAVAITLSCSGDENTLHIKLGNSFTASGLLKKGTGTGLKNIQNRLMLTYGSSGLFKINKTDQYFEVHLMIPQ